MKIQTKLIFAPICLLFLLSINAYSRPIFRADICNLNYYPVINNGLCSSEFDYSLLFLGFEKQFYEFGFDVEDGSFLYSYKMTQINKTSGTTSTANDLLESYSYLPVSGRLYFLTIVKRPFSLSLSAFGKYYWNENFDIGGSFNSVTCYGAPRCDYGTTFDFSFGLFSLRLNLASSHYQTNKGFSNKTEAAVFPHSSWSTPFALALSFLIDRNLVFDRMKKGLFEKTDAYYVDTDKNKLIADNNKFIAAVMRKDKTIADKTIGAFKTVNGAPFIYAIKNNDSAMLQNLSAMGNNYNEREYFIDVNALAVDGSRNFPVLSGSDSITPLMFCAIENNYKMAEILLRFPADPNVKSGVKRITALAYATLYKNEEVKTLLLSHGADPNIANNYFVIDVDGNVYHTVRIGRQVWTLENFRSTKYNDGAAIPLVKENNDWKDLSTPGYCWYNNDAGNKEEYGALYNWYAVDTKKLAPPGWRVPTDDDWNILENYLINHGYNWDRSKKGNKIAKSLAAGWNWIEPNSFVFGTVGCNIVENNKSGFSALPGGDRGGDGRFIGKIGSTGSWWSSTSYDTSRAYDRSIGCGSIGLFGDVPSLKKCGGSVRLLREY